MLIYVHVVPLSVEYARLSQVESDDHDIVNDVSVSLAKLCEMDG